MTRAVAPALDPHSLLDVDVRLYVELGRARMPLAQAVALPDGAVVDLDRAPEEPVDVFVNGERFGWGRLVVVDGEWALRLERLASQDGAAAAPAKAGSAGEVLTEAAAQAALQQPSITTEPAGAPAD